MKNKNSGNARKAIQIAVMAGLASGVAQAADSFFLNVPNVKGESTNEKYKDWIDVLSFSQSVSSRNCPRFVLFKNVDLSTPPLLAAAANGSSYPDMTLAGAAILGGPQVEYLNVKMTNVVVTSSRQSGTTGAVGATEEIVLDPAGVTVTYTEIDSKGGPGAKTTSTYSCKLG